uniref:Immunoglobulin V-set domain-containing protein n=1 Tax=Myripristis murdjan TaxID=586833 RepID=A0A668ATG2_9TELE
MHLSFSQISHEISFYDRNLDVTSHYNHTPVFRIGETEDLPFAVSLKRSWLNPGNVLFKLSNENFSPHNTDDDKRLSVSGDPSSSWLNVTMSELRPSDTDRYYCEFLVEKFPVDREVRGKTEFFLYVTTGESGGDTGPHHFLFGHVVSIRFLFFRRVLGAQPCSPAWTHMGRARPWRG